jgi:hypothetical protein
MCTRKRKKGAKTNIALKFFQKVGLNASFLIQLRLNDKQHFN